MTNTIIPLNAKNPIVGIAIKLDSQEKVESKKLRKDFLNGYKLLRTEH